MKSYISGRRKSQNQEILKHIPPFYDVPRADNELEFKRKPKLMKKHKVVQQLFNFQANEI